MRPALLYDDECAFCRWTLAHLLRRDKDERLRIVPLRSPEAPTLLPDFTPAQRAEAAHLVTAERQVFSGGAAAAPLARVLGAGDAIVAVLRVLEVPVRVGYRLIAANRGLLSRLVPARAQHRADEMVRRRLAA